MDNEQIVAIIHEFLLLSLILVAPTVATSLIVGLLISLLQTVTSIQEQTMTFAPRILAVAAVWKPHPQLDTQPVNRFFTAALSANQPSGHMTTRSTFAEPFLISLPPIGNRSSD